MNSPGYYSTGGAISPVLFCRLVRERERDYYKPMKTNYHTHTTYCDGIADAETVVRAALEQNFDILGFSSHQPLNGEEWTMAAKDVPAYAREIRSLAEKYKKDILILCGMERDFFSKEPVWPVRIWEDIPLDFVIGSVHSVFPPSSDRFASVDGPVEEVKDMIETGYGGNARQMVEDYYDALALMVRRETIDFVGHLDVMKKQNKKLGFLDESEFWYLSKVRSVLDEIARKGVPLEINTGGISRGATDDLYPSQPILRECRKRNIPILINSDAHNPEHLGFAFDRAREAALDAGYREQMILDREGWRSIVL